MNSVPRPHILVPLRVFLKISDEHPRHFYRGVLLRESFVLIVDIFQCVILNP